MSATEDTPPSPKHYKPGSGNNRYARFCEDWLAFERTQVFDTIAHALDSHKQTLVIGGNGTGKSYGASGLGIAALYCNPHTVVPITAGNGDTVKNSIWKNIKSLWRNSQLPGDYKDNDRSLHTGFDDKWFLECHSPANAEDLEGDHNQNVVYIIEEAEKPGVTEQHIDSARSTLAEDDHILVLCNPPVDESNVVYKLSQKESWHVIRIPTWESRNALVDRGLSNKEKIHGLSGTGKMREDWREYHDDPWPGVEQAIRISSPHLTEDGTPTISERDGVTDNPDFRDDLHRKWYKRRVGISPPQSSQVWRPFSLGEVKRAYNNPADSVRETPQTLGIDVARDVDETVMTGLYDLDAQVEYTSQTDHAQQRRDVTGMIREWPKQDIAVDAVGKGEPLADELKQRFPNVREFNNGSKALDEDNYRDKWAEGLYHIGEWLRNGGTFDHSRLFEELSIASRVIEFSEVDLRSRGGAVIEATPKDRVKDELGTSPDYLDSLLMCVWADRTEITQQRAAPTFSW